MGKTNFLKSSWQHSILLYAKNDFTHYNMFKGHTSRWQVIPEINKGLVRLAEKEGAAYIDLYSHFIDKETGKMNTAYTNDGLHLLGKGYLKWVEIVKPYIGKK